MMTDVVPSPTSSSCVRLSWIMDCSRVRVRGHSRQRQREGGSQEGEQDGSAFNTTCLAHTYLGSWVRHVDLTEDGVAVICYHNACKIMGNVCDVMHAPTWV